MVNTSHLTCLYNSPDEVEVLALLVVLTRLPAIIVMDTIGPLGFITIGDAICRF